MTSLRGTVVSGLGHGAHFMSVPWVRDAVQSVLGFVPYPGTLNVKLDPAVVDAWERILDACTLGLPLPSGETCGARLIPVMLAGVEAAVIVPDVTAHGKNLLEVVAPIHLRARCGLGDDDPVTLHVLT